MTRAALAQPRSLLPGRPARRGRRTAAVLMLAVLLAAGTAALPYVYAQGRAPAALDAQTLERNVKAAFLFKFMSYVEWPANDGPVVAIGVVGSEEMAAALGGMLAGRTVDGKPLVVRQIGENDALAGLHAVYVGGADGQAALLRRAQQRGVLSVTDAEDGLARGSVINFTMVEGRVRFDVSLDAAERSGLRLSSRLLAVAHQVQKGGQ